MSNWLVSVFSIFGAFGLCGIGGAIFGKWLPSSEFSIEGFCAAFGVVSIAYLSAPHHKKLYSVFWFLLGAATAFYLLYPDISRNDSRMPFLSTLGGGLLVLVVIFSPQLRTTNNNTL